METLTNYKKELDKLYNIKDTEEDTQSKRIKLKLQKNNTLLALFEDVKNKVVEIWNKYENKSIGEKTTQKIQQEIENAFDNEIFVYINYINIHITTRTKDKKYTGETKITLFANNNSYYGIKTQENKAIKLNIEDVRIAEVKTFVENLDKSVKKIEELHQKAYQKQEEIKELVEQINKLTNYSINIQNGFRINPYIIY